MRVRCEQALIKSINFNKERIIHHTSMKRRLERELMEWYAKEKDRYYNWLSNNR